MHSHRYLKYHCGFSAQLLSMAASGAFLTPCGWVLLTGWFSLSLTGKPMNMFVLGVSTLADPLNISTNPLSMPGSWTSQLLLSQFASNLSTLWSSIPTTAFGDSINSPTTHSRSPGKWVLGPAVPLQLRCWDLH